MKDLPHHIKKLQRETIRSERREEHMEEIAGPEIPLSQRPKEQQRKQKKQQMKAEREAHIPIHPTEEERNQEMKHRTPVFDRNNQKPKHTPPSHKKTPPI